MKKLLLILALTLVAITGNAQSSPRGDMDNDGVVSVSDVMELVGIILNGDAPQSYLTCPDNHHPHLIDLGLPSGTKWACCNVGADTPEAYGGYYAWGETEEKSTYSWSNYIHCNGSRETVHDLGSDIAGTQYDVAHVKWGGYWMMPSKAQQDELRNYCTYKWTTVNGVNGGKFTSKTNGASIFLPAAGHRITILRNANESGGCWSSTQNPSNSDIAFYLQFYSDNAAGQSRYRYVGQSVRPIYVGDTYKALALSKSNVETFAGKSTTVEITSGSGYYKVSSSAPNVAEASLSGSTITIKGVAAGLAVIVVTDTKSGSSQYIIATVKQAYLTCPDDHHPHVIDLGLPSGTLWACCNVGANTPKGYGGYYAWGETDVKSTYNWNTYIHCDGSKETCHDLGSDIAGTEYDVAHVKWGGSWVMPSEAQQDELINNCTYEWTTVNGVNGGKFTSKTNGASIFLPAAGYLRDDILNNAGSTGLYWSSTQYPSGTDDAYFLYFYSGYTDWNINYRYYGQSVRPVVRN